MARSATKAVKSVFVLKCIIYVPSYPSQEKLILYYMNSFSIYIFFSCHVKLFEIEEIYAYK